MKWLTWILLTTKAAAGDCIAVNGDNILARDIAAKVTAFAVVDSTVRIGFTPRPGVQRIFSEKELRMLARRFGLTLDLPAPSVCIERKSALLSPDAIRSAIAQSLRMEPDRVEVVDFSRAALPLGEIQFPLEEAVRPTASPVAPFTWRGRLIADGRSYPLWATVRVRVERNLVRATVPIRSGQLIKEGSAAVLLTKVSPFDTGGVEDIAEVLGKLAKRDLAEGQIIRKIDLSLPREVSQGDAVRVRALNGQAQITFDAKAQTAGRTGDTILIQNPANGRSFRAKVVGKGEVECDSSR